MKFFLSLILSISLLLFNNADAMDLKQGHVNKVTNSVQAYLNSLQELAFSFSQIDTDGVVREGKLYIKKPRQVRIDYFTPEEESLIIDENFITLYNKPLDEINYINGDVPIAFLSKSNINLRKDAKITNAFEQNGIMSLELEVPHKNGYHIIILSFKKNPMVLHGIRVLGSDGNVVDLTVHKINYDKISDSVFDIVRKTKR